MKRLTKKVKRMHYELWDWLYRNPSRAKCQHPNWWHNGGNWPDVRANCFLCELFSPVCERCPLTKANKDCVEIDSWWTRWGYARSLSTKRKYAKKIRDIFEGEI